MIFNSVSFLCIFLPVMLTGYFLLPKKAKNVWLLLGSLFFYAWGGPKHLIFLVSSIVINYAAALLISKLSTEGVADERGNNTVHFAAQKAVLAVTVVLNIGSLIYFKYIGMLFETARDLFNPTLNIPEVILPLGISFYTFQCLSYVIDVYRIEGAKFPDGKVNTIITKNVCDFALFVTFFPQLLQGPIIRFSDVKDTLRNPQTTLDDVISGIERFIVGLSKKALIANTIGEVADNIFAGDPAYMSVSVAWLGAILYTLQIYFDFAGYTDMAIGLGKMFGFKIRENFDYPYISKSITEFWRRWHITLSNWFRDYLYIPLGGNRKGNVYVNLLIVFLATGIWHGAAWGFLVWGLWHGLFMLIERALKGKSVGIKLPAFLSGLLKWLYTMLVVTLGWVLFKIEDIVEALKYIGAMFHVKSHTYNAFSLWYFLDKRLIFFLVIAIIACVPWAQILPRHLAAYVADFASSKKGAFRVARQVCLIILMILCFIFVVNNTYSPFIYFQF